MYVHLERIIPQPSISTCTLHGTAPGIDPPGYKALTVTSPASIHMVLSSVSPSDTAGCICARWAFMPNICLSSNKTQIRYRARKDIHVQGALPSPCFRVQLWPTWRRVCAQFDSTE